MVDVNSFKADWLRLSFYGSNGERLPIIDANVGSVAESVGLYGPWITQQGSDYNDHRSSLREMFGLEQHTLTALFELVVSSSNKLISESKPMIDRVQVDYDNQLSRRQDPIANPVDCIQLDYLSSSDKS